MSDDKKMDDTVDEAISDIMRGFEELLMRHKIMIPSVDRDGEPDEAHLYGDEYYDLEDRIRGILQSRDKKIRAWMRDEIGAVKSFLSDIEHNADQIGNCMLSLSHDFPAVR